jgi:hypothetical protein
MKIRIIKKDGTELKTPSLDDDEELIKNYLFSKFYVRGPFNINDGNEDFCSNCNKENALYNYKYKHENLLMLSTFCDRECLYKFLFDIDCDNPVNNVKETAIAIDEKDVKKESHFDYIFNLFNEKFDQNKIATVL